jgi:signal transduction histidine kinase
VFFLLFDLYSQARPLPPLPPDGSFTARGHIWFRPDPTNKLTLADILQSPASFTPVPANIPQFGKNQPPHWLRCPVANLSSSEQSFVLEVDFPFLDTVQFFQLTNGNLLVTQSKPIGWVTPLAARPERHRNPLFYFSLPAGSTSQIYIRASAGQNRLSVPIRLWTREAFRDYDRSDRTFWGWMIGIFICIVFISGLLYVLLRDQVYGYYALYGLASALYMVSIEGFWLEWIDRADYGFITANDFRHIWNYTQAILNVLFLRWFILRDVIRLRRVKWVYFISLSAICLNMLYLLLSYQFPLTFTQHNSWILLIGSLNYFLPVAAFTVLVIWIAFRPDSRHTLLGQSAQMYLLSMTPLLLVTALSLLRNYNVVPDHFLLRNEGNALAIVFEFIILNIGLGYRYKRILDERQRLTEETHQQQQESIETQLRLQKQEVLALEAQLRFQREKERIARDLHDHVGSQLSIIATSLDYPAESARFTQRAATVSSYAREAIQSLRDAIWAIHQEQVSLIEFRIKIQQYIQQQQKLIEGCQLLLQGDAWETYSLSSIQALNLFRIVQEALTNAIKYAQATQITISYHLTEEYTLSLTIEDNGLGFCQQHKLDRPHYGLLNMQHRATDAGGYCRIKTEPGCGTSVQVMVALDTKNTLTTV